MDSRIMTTPSNAAPTPQRRDLLWAIAVWAVLAAAMLVGYRESIALLRLPDPDDALRLVQVRDLLAGQYWYDFTQYRINPAEGGGQLHWSRFIDGQIAALILLLQQFLPGATAERWALALYPVLLTLPLLLIFSRLLGHLGDRVFVATGLLVAATTFSFLHYFVPLRIDHHGWQLLLSLALLWLAMGEATLRRGLAAALVISMHVEISLEGLPYLVIFGGLFALDWLRDPATAPRLRGFALGLGVILPTWIALWRGINAVTGVYCDAFSRPFVAGAVVTGLGIAAAMSLPGVTARWQGRLAALALAGLAGGAAFVLVGPVCLAGPFGNLTPLVRTFWYEGISEGRPIWEMGPGILLSFLAPSLIGLAGLVWSARRMAGTPQSRDWWRLVLAAGGSFILSLLVLRTTSTTHAFVVPGYVLLVLGIFHWGRSFSSAALRVPATAACIIALPLSVSALSVAVTPLFEKDEDDAMPTDCMTPAAVARLNQLPPTTIFAALDFSPAILVGTQHKVVASGHHRNHRAIHRVLDAFMSPDPKAQRLVRETGATHVAICRNLAEHLNFVKFGKGGLAAALHKNAPPAWLVAEPRYSLGSLQVFRIVGAKPR
jgi:hypothetical protein